MLPGAGPKKLLSAVRALFVNNLLKKVVTFVINQNKRQKIFYFNFPNSFHTQLQISNAFQMLNALLRQYRRQTANTTKVKAAVFIARVGNLLTAVTFRQHNHAAAVKLQQIHVKVHTACSS